MRKTIPLLLLAATVLLAAEKTPSPILSWVEAPPLAADKGEQRILDVLAQMAARDGRGDLNITPDDGRLLRLLAESAGARHVVEIGTSHGYSGLWFTLALRRTGGRLTTHEIDADRVETARGNFRQAGVEDLVAIVRGDAHETVANVNEPVDILFLDGDKDGNMDYLEQLLPRIRPGGLIIAHSAANQADRMSDYLQAVTTNPQLETRFFHMTEHGLAVTLKKRILTAGD